MGIGGHILGPRKLRRLQSLTGLPLDRAYIRNHEAEGVVVIDGHCHHYEIDPGSGRYREYVPQFHWTSCPRRS